MAPNLKKYFLKGAALALGFTSAVALAYTWSLFQPASGILVGNPNTYITTAATSSNVISLWTGTCSSSTYLNGAGTCGTPAGTGVSSVGLSAPSVFSVSGSPVTSSGTLALSFATGQTANQVLASPNGTTGAITLRALVGADIPAINLSTTGNGGVIGTINLASTGAGGVTGTLPVTNGGEGLATATLGDIRYGSGTNILAALAGNTTSTKKFLTQTGTGSVSAAPAWGTIASSDVPAAGSNQQILYNNSGVVAGATVTTATTGGLTIAAPTANGTALTVTDFSGTQAAIFNCTSVVNCIQIQSNTSGVSAGITLYGGDGTTETGNLTSNATNTILVSDIGSLNFKTPSGQGLNYFINNITQFSIDQYGGAVFAVPTTSEATIIDKCSYSSSSPGPCMSIYDTGTGPAEIDMYGANSTTTPAKIFSGSATQLAFQLLNSSGQYNFYNSSGVSIFNIFQTSNPTIYEANYGIASTAPAATYGSGSFTATLTGFSGTVTGTINYTRTGNVVTLYESSNINGTSNTTAMTATGLPSGLAPANAQACSVSSENNGTFGIPTSITISGTTLTFAPYNGTNYTSSGYTASGTKGINQMSCVYTLQ